MTATAELRSYGRRRGRRAVAADGGGCAALELRGAAPHDSTLLFQRPVRDVWLEIGFGAGEHLLWQANAHPDVGFIGAEPYLDGAAKVLRAVEKGRLANVRVFGDDVRPLLRWLPRSSLGRVFVLFPDPWPKKRHHKRRLMSASFLELVAGATRPGAELRVATDIDDYARTTLLAVRANGAFEWTATRPADWRQRPADWPQTRYEVKAETAGRPRYFLTFRRSCSGA